MLKIGIALSGGGARGIAHLGVLKALEKFGIKPDVISGVSAGAIVGGFYAAGYTPMDILAIMKGADLFSVFSLKFRQGIFSMDTFEKIYLTHIPHNSFEQLNLPLHVAATDILKGESVYFSEGELAKAIMASSCVPLAFEPVLYQGRELFDGGILNNLPLEPLEGQCDVTIGVHVNAIDTATTHVHTRDLADRSFHLSLGAAVRQKAPLFDLFIEPPAMSRFGMFDLDDADAIFSAGYEYAMAMADEIAAFQGSL
jgi:NTE family protein